MFCTYILLIILKSRYILYFRDKRDEKSNGSSSKSRKKSPDREKDTDRPKSKEKTIKTESEYDIGSADKVIVLIFSLCKT